MRKRWAVLWKRGEIAKLLESYGYNCLNVDTGIYDSFYYACPPMYMPKGYLVELAAKAKILNGSIFLSIKT